MNAGYTSRREAVPAGAVRGALEGVIGPNYPGGG